MAQPAHRIGLIVPSSNTTMETEIPAMLRARAEIRPETFTFHSSRMRMKHVDPAELAAMDAESLRCAVELSDARVDVMAYACLVAIMAQGTGYHRESQKKLAAAAAEESGTAIPVVSSAGALTEALHHLGARRIAVIAPYMRSLTATVCAYIEHEGVEVVDSISLEVPDNLAVGRLDPENLKDLAEQVDTSRADALVLSACVQMPSLPVLDAVQQRFDIPVLSAASATVWRILTDLGLDPVVPRAGALLAPR
ncbi:maleate cis-trans isomerase family protein [Pseudonocardia thermophila]|jgi:Maleate cis-trans isomerase|uniref:maleate cis-trans isomerase family protein n=1 Tax=Pseudonocardia thermophila TaxID=1848 RepID=UPI00248EFF8C|nr:Asp/Glu racemase [Pseudonocardia thermophila]